MTRKGSTSALVAGMAAVALCTTMITSAQRGAPGAPAAPAGQGAGGRGGGRAGGGGFGGGGRGAQPQVANVLDVQQMLAALPDTAPAAPKQPRKVLVLAKAAGFVHSSIPLASRMIEALGNKTRAWDTVITFNAADINEENLKQYDAIFLASTTGTFLDDPNDAAVTAARRKALLDFIRGGKGIAGVHAATDSYHGGQRGAAPPAGAPAAAPAGGRQAGAPAAGAAAAAGRGGGGGAPLWPEFNKLIGGYFKFHWTNGTQIHLKVEDVANPINAPFTQLNQQTGARTARNNVQFVDEIYTFNQDSWSRDRSHVLLSIDYDRMPENVKKQEPEPQRTDHDYAISYIQREGGGRVFVTVLGHDESIYKMRPVLEHVLAGMQYALGDLQADDTPTNAMKK